MSDGYFDAEHERTTCVHCRIYNTGHTNFQNNWICKKCWDTGKRGQFHKVIISGLHEPDYELIHSIYEYIADKKSLDGSYIKLRFYHETSESWIDDLKESMEKQDKS